MRVAALLAATATLATLGLAGQAAADEIFTAPRQDAVADRWDGFQFLAADGKGAVYVLRADTLEIFTLEAGKRPSPAGSLVPREGLQGKVVEAVMSADGDRWLLRTTAGQLPLFEDGEEVRRLPEPDWQIESLAFLGSDPVAVVLPGPGGGSPFVEALDEDPPWVLQATDWGWEPLVAPSLPPGLDTDDWNAARLERAGVVTPGRGRFWLAHWYAYRVDEYTSGGTRDLRLEVGLDGAPKRLAGEDVGAAKEAMAAEAAKSGDTDGRPPWTIEPAAYTYAFGAATEGRDGRLYLFVRSDYADTGRARLDRFDPVALQLESLDLAFTAGGRVRLAAGKDGLWVAAAQGTNGRWFLSWPELDEATWEPVEEATLNGLPLHGPESEPTGSVESSP